VEPDHLREQATSGHVPQGLISDLPQGQRAYPALPGQEPLRGLILGQHLGSHVQPQQAALETHFDPLGQAAPPGFCVLAQQLLLPPYQLFSTRVVLVQSGQGTLQTDELSAVGVAVLLQPVGEDQAQAIIVGIVADGSQEGSLLVVGHSHHGFPQKKTRPRM
jgi:hypothetical protein